MKKYLKIFVTAFLIFGVCIGAVIIPTKGIWLYYGDFNVQTIPFYVHVHDALRNGHFLYDWSTDLGGSLIGCYSFYILGSPFFWLSLPFPTEAVPYVIPWINALKYAVMATTAYAYMRRHLKTEGGAFAGALLFAFSGFQGAVLVYNHFHDAIAFFPLMLLAFEDAMEKRKYARFSVMTAIMLVINYYFFVGQVVFLAIVFFCRYWEPKKFKANIKKLAAALVCGVAGVLAASVYFLPAVYYTMGNSRISDTLSGYDALAYKEPTMLLAILKNTIMLSDISGLNSMFNMGYSRVSGVAAYIPLFSISAVMAWFICNKKHWTKKVLSVCLVCAVVPFLNAVFSAMNSEYYARWFYMPVLIMAMVTASVIENMNEDVYPAFRKGVKYTALITVALWLCALVPAYDSDEKLTILGALKNPEQLLAQIIFSALMLAWLLSISLISIPKKLRQLKKDDIDGSLRNKNVCYKYLVIASLIACFLTNATMIISGEFLIEAERKESFVKQAFRDADDLQLPNGAFYRIETEGDVYNYPLIWSTPSITSFISTIPFSTIDFYESLGITRKVTSRLPENKVGARNLLSAKFFLVENENTIPIEKINHVENTDDIKGYSYYDTRDGFDIYKNDSYIPMGFSFEKYMTEQTYESIESNLSNRDRILLDAIVLSEEDARKYGSYMNEISKEAIPAYSLFDVERLCRERRAASCPIFETSTYGFRAEADMTSDNLLFFSVPYEAGFKAYVDKEEKEIVKADFGMMAVEVPKGYHEIEFKYSLMYFKEGKIASCIGIAAIIILGIVSAFFNRKATNG